VIRRLITTAVLPTPGGRLVECRDAEPAGDQSASRDSHRAHRQLPDRLGPPALIARPFAIRASPARIPLVIGG